MAFYVGVDGGGSKTSCVVGDESSVLGQGMGGGSNLVRMGEARAWETIASVIQQACDSAGVQTSQVSRACIGLAGSADPQMSPSSSHILSRLFLAEVQLVTDAAIALEAAHGDLPGVVVIAGTGSIAYGRSRDGEGKRAGGWGFAVGDEGSGYWIGKSAVTLSLRVLDDDGDRRLLQVLMDEWGIQSLDEMIARSNATPAPNFAALFPAVLRAAEHGNATSLQLLDKAGEELARLGAIVIRSAFAEGEAVPVGMSGGVFQNSAQIRESFYNGLRSQFAQVAIGSKPIEPVMGALDMARKGSARSQ